MTKTDPSAPSDDRDERFSPPYNQPPPVVNETQAAPNPQAHASTSPYQEPPPDYQTAMSYPSHPMPYQQPASNPVYPKPPYSVQGYPLAPPPAPIHTGGYQTAHPSTPVVVQVVRDVPMLRCAHCQNGLVVRETDICCLVCLILMAIITFPLGLFFLCCVPCSIHRRCDACGRIG